MHTLSVVDLTKMLHKGVCISNVELCSTCRSIENHTGLHADLREKGCMDFSGIAITQ